MKNLKFSLKIQKVPVSIESEDGKIVEMTISEMDAASRDKYLDQMSDRMNFDAKGQPAGIKKFAGLQSELLIKCLKRKDGKELTEEEIQTWPASVVQELYTEAQELNHLERGEEEVPKNS